MSVGLMMAISSSSLVTPAFTDAVTANADSISEIPAALCIEGDQWKRADPSLVFPKVTGFLGLLEEGNDGRDRHRYAATCRSGLRHRPAVPALPARPVQSSPSHRDGAIDPLAGAPAGQCAELPCRLLLRAPLLRRSDRERGNAGVDAGPGLRLDPRHPQPRASGSVAPGHQGGARGPRIDLQSALARRAHLASGAAAP